MAPPAIPARLYLAWAAAVGVALASVAVPAFAGPAQPRWSHDRTLVFRAESNNFFNTPQFAEPNYNLISPSFGAITNTLNDGRVFRLRLQFQF